MTVNYHTESMTCKMLNCVLAGIEDSVKCFSCNITLRSWERGDDPWTEHARWSPRCDYVKTVKGEAFICNVQAAFSGQVTSGHCQLLGLN